MQFDLLKGEGCEEAVIEKKSERKNQVKRKECVVSKFKNGDKLVSNQVQFGSDMVRSLFNGSWDIMVLSPSSEFTGKGLNRKAMCWTQLTISELL